MKRRVALFVTCLVDQLRPAVGRAAVAVLEKAGCAVEFDPRQTCCGQPAFNAGHRAEAARVLKLGVRGVVVKQSAIDLLLRAIRAVHSGEYWVGREVIGELVRALEGPTVGTTRRTNKMTPFGLTKRELELVRLVAAGYSNRDISRECSRRRSLAIQMIACALFATGTHFRRE